MLTIEKILLPVDFSERSTAAGMLAKAIGLRFRAEVTMLYVVPTLEAMHGAETTGAGLTDWIDRLQEEANVRLKNYMADDFDSVWVERIVAEGDPATQIVRVAHEGGFNVIVMPTHGYGRFRRFVLGSVTAKVLHDADCPVLTGAHIAETTPFDGAALQSVLCAVDLGVQSEKALAWAARISTHFHAKLHVVHALPPIESGIARYLDSEMRSRIEGEAAQRLGELTNRLGVSPEIVFEHGEVPAVVRAAASQTRAGLTVIGRHHGAGVLGRLRAHAYGIVRESPCPVLSV